MQLLEGGLLKQVNVGLEPVVIQGFHRFFLCCWLLNLSMIIKIKTYESIEIFLENAGDNFGVIRYLQKGWRLSILSFDSDYNREGGIYHPPWLQTYHGELKDVVFIYIHLLVRIADSWSNERDSGYSACLKLNRYRIFILVVRKSRDVSPET